MTTAEYIGVPGMASTDSATWRGRLEPGRRTRYALAGNATITVRSPSTDARFTYRITRADPKGPNDSPPWFVGLLYGPDNTADYRYIGLLTGDGSRFVRTRKSTVSAESPSAVAIQWVAAHWESDKFEAWHEGRCGRCGRTLTVPESIESGIGPTCAGKA